ncbi:MAG: hypothetical protein BWY57_00334 [Betaproteobacteria bacterium ADurb.Bin341]|nr:MAG: hypothetical protein BWY57_00334 [Betaproteobacteria bacterium ADurb.Bin341]
MKIASSNLEMASSHVATQTQEVRESLRMWTGQTRPDFEGRNQQTPQADPVVISDAGKAAQAADAVEAQEDALENDPRMMLIRSLIEFLTGKKIKIVEASELKAPPPGQEVAEAAQARQSQAQGNGFGIEYDYHASYRETEETTFSASGVVKTADGKTIEFDLQFAMQRSYSEQTDVSVRIGDAVRKQDPLVINFGGTAAQLTDARFKFDLDADGTAENINFVRPGSGFLVFDRNHDGKANDGSELFGPATGNGFNELALLDADKNGWIDENDAAYQDLRVWIKDAEGQDTLMDLQEAKVGAIALAHIATPFDLKDAANDMLGQVRSTSIYLKEEGGVGTVQQIDLTV